MQAHIYDSIIVGSGAGGAAAAYRLSIDGHQVLLIEKGEALTADGSTLDIDQVVRLGTFKSKELWADANGREIVPEEHFNVGGKTKWYGAALARFSPEEFEGDTEKGLLPWPITYADLEPYYAKAEQLLGARSFDCEPDLAIIAGRLARNSGWQVQPILLGLHPSILDFPEEARHFDGFASVRKLKSDAESSFLQRISDMPNVTLLTGRAVASLLGNTADPSRIEGVVLRDGSEFRGRTVLLAAGALHSPRLLQRYLENTGLAANLPVNKTVGRNLKMHLLTALIALSPGRKTDVLRKTRLLLNAHYPRSSVQPLGFDGELISTLVPRMVPRRMARFLGKRAYGFFLQTEDRSDPQNRVLAADDSGTHSPVLDYLMSRQTTALREHRRLIAGLMRCLARAGYLSFAKRIGVEGTAHVCGTLVAGTDPHTSVVDAAGCVHGMSGLYVVDGSVLPRSSRVNPSLTIYAWAMRVADGLLQSQRAAA